ncbi:MAG: response regulator [Gemmatimonadales bacterium]
MSHTVLICDDAVFMRSLLREILEQAGYEVVGEATTGTEAVDRYKELRPDLVTLEVVMPGLGGIDVVREIVESFPEARILMCSALGQQALIAEATEAGAREFVVKPFQPSRVLEAVQRVLE